MRESAIQPQTSGYLIWLAGRIRRRAWPVVPCSWQKRSNPSSYPVRRENDSTLRYHFACPNAAHLSSACSIQHSRYTSSWQEDRAVAAVGVAQAMSDGGGKSELRRAVCRITSGMWASRPADGQCHRKDTASANPPSGGRPGMACGLVRNAAPRSGKGEMVR